MSTTTLCTHLCGSTVTSHTFFCTFLVDAYLDRNPKLVKRIYVAIDDQSNVSLIDNKLMDYFGVTFPKQIYKMSTAHSHCKITTTG